MVAATGAMAGAAPGLARAEGQPNRWVLRPLTLPQAALRFDGGLVFTSRYDASVCPPGRCRVAYLDLYAGMAGGITEDVEIGAVVAPLLLAPELAYGNPSLYAMWRFVSTRVADIGVRFSLSFPVRDAFAHTIGLPIELRLGEIVRMDMGPYFTVTYSRPLGARFAFPFVVAFQPAYWLFFGVETGFAVDERTNVDVPVGGFVGFTIPGRRGPIGDIVPRFRLPDATIGFDEWQVLVDLRFYVYLK